jgi:hypothetical protein
MLSLTFNAAISNTFASSAILQLDVFDFCAAAGCRMHNTSIVLAL